MSTLTRLLPPERRALVGDALVLTTAVSAALLGLITLLAEEVGLSVLDEGGDVVVRAEAAARLPDPFADPVGDGRASVGGSARGPWSPGVARHGVSPVRKATTRLRARRPAARSRGS